MPRNNQTKRPAPRKPAKTAQRKLCVLICFISHPSDRRMRKSGRHRFPEAAGAGDAGWGPPAEASPSHRGCDGPLEGGGKPAAGPATQPQDQDFRILSASSAGLKKPLSVVIAGVNLGRVTSTAGVSASPPFRAI